MAYATRADLEMKWGAENIKKWGDADNNKNAAHIDARITRVCSRASSYIDDRLRNMYAVPFSPVPDAIAELCETLAGVMLYASPRGLVSGGEEGDIMQFHRDEVERVLLEICAGHRKLSPGLDVDNAPQTVNVTLD